jgi:hypothetical protein
MHVDENIVEQHVIVLHMKYLYVHVVDDGMKTVIHMAQQPTSPLSKVELAITVCFPTHPQKSVKLLVNNTATSTLRPFLLTNSTSSLKDDKKRKHVTYS